MLPQTPVMWWQFLLWCMREVLVWTANWLLVALPSVYLCSPGSLMVGQRTSPLHHLTLSALNYFRPGLVTS